MRDARRTGGLNRDQDARRNHIYTTVGRTCGYDACLKAFTSKPEGELRVKPSGFAHTSRADRRPFPVCDNLGNE